MSVRRGSRSTARPSRPAAGPAFAGEPLLGRREVLREIRRYLDRDLSVLLLGPRDVGKSAVIEALRRPDLLILDPLMHVTPRLAGEIRLAMDRGARSVAATRTVDRAEMGAVRRLAYRFTTVRVPPLSSRWMRELVRRICAAHGADAMPAPAEWQDGVVRLSAGLPGVALSIVDAARLWRLEHGRLPSPRAAYVEASIARVELHHAMSGLGVRPPSLGLRF
ncbi:MAG: hypothetical protein ACRENQ_03885 [Gemmatimonadaceae bacterium]